MKNNNDTLTNNEFHDSSFMEPEIVSEGSHLPNDNPLSINFPWLSLLASLLAIGFLIILSDPQLIEFYRIPDILMSNQTKFTFLVFMMVSSIRLVRNCATRWAMRTQTHCPPRCSHRRKQNESRI